MNVLNTIANELHALRLDEKPPVIDVDMEDVTDHKTDKLSYSIYPVSVKTPLSFHMFNVAVVGEQADVEQLKDVNGEHALALRNSDVLPSEDYIRCEIRNALYNALQGRTLYGEPLLRTVERVKLVWAEDVQAGPIPMTVCRLDVHLLTKRDCDVIDVAVFDEDDLPTVSRDIDQIRELGDLDMFITAPAKLRGKQFDAFVCSHVAEVIDCSPEVPYVDSKCSIVTPKNGVYTIPKIDNVLINMTDHHIEVDGYKVIASNEGYGGHDIVIMGFIVDFTDISRGVYQTNQAYGMRCNDVAQMFFAAKRNDDGVVVLEPLRYEDVTAIASGYEYVNDSHNQRQRRRAPRYGSSRAR